MFTTSIYDMLTRLFTLRELRANYLVRMLNTLRLEQPAGLKESTLREVKWCLPFSYEVGEVRRGGRNLPVRYKPSNDDPIDTAGTGLIQWAVLGSSSATPSSRSPAVPQPSAAPPQQPSPPTPAPSRAPSDSHLEIILPFSRSAALREQYQRFTSDRMRFGLLLEDLDTLAGDIAARHAGITDRVLLTASIDRISWLQDPTIGEVTISHDLRMAGQVVWAGRSSMEVMIELSCQEPPPRISPQQRSPPSPLTAGNNHNRGSGSSGSGSSSAPSLPTPSSSFSSSAPNPSSGAWHHIGVAFFVLVARSPDRTAAANVPPLVPVTRRELELFEQGAVHMRLRQTRRDSHWGRKPPTGEEVILIHDLIRNHAAHKAAAHHHHHHTSQRQLEAVPMAKTVLQSSSIMHAQDRNAFYVIFGGHLLKLAYEHAFATAALHAGEYCDPISMDDVAFLQPVPIGTILRLTGIVVYCEGPCVRVHVRATKLEPGAPEQSVVTNVFSFAFLCPSGPVRRVVPETMVEAMQYVQGHRQQAADDACQAVIASLAVSRL